MKVVGVVLLIILAFVAGFIVAEQEVAARYQSGIVRLKGEADIYRNEAEKYAQTLRTIRETAAQATVTEKAK